MIDIKCTQQSKYSDINYKGQYNLNVHSKLFYTIVYLFEMISIRTSFPFLLWRKKKVFQKKFQIFNLIKLSFPN